MRTGNLLFLCAAAALPLGAQVIATCESWHGIQVQFFAKLEPPPAKTTNPAILSELDRELHGSAVFVDDRVHRFWEDSEQKVYGGYDLAVEPGSGPDSFQLHISPLSLTSKQIGNWATWTQRSLSKYPVIPEVRVGDTVTIDILANPTTGQKMVDYLTIERTGPPAPPSPHDFSLSDVGLIVSDPRLSIDGKPVEATAHFAGRISGPTVWFYLKGHGRFSLSLFGEPDPRFRKAGEVYGKILTFREDGREYRLESSGRIAPSPGKFNIYVFHDRAWQPREGDKELFILGSFPQERMTGK